jgi:hypothetical protein
MFTAQMFAPLRQELTVHHFGVDVLVLGRQRVPEHLRGIHRVGGLWSRHSALHRTQVSTHVLALGIAALLMQCCGKHIPCYQPLLILFIEPLHSTPPRIGQPQPHLPGECLAARHTLLPSADVS